MMILVSGSTLTVHGSPPDRVGVLLTPNSRQSIARIKASGRAWAADNSAFSGFNPRRFVSMLDAIDKQDRPRSIRWITAPDSVGDHDRTLALFQDWRGEIRRRRLPCAFVAQDGARPDLIPWREIAAVFIGGSTRWKLSDPAIEIIRAAQARGLWTHVGRVNTRNRIAVCLALGVDSIDGSQFSKWAEVHLPWAIRQIEAGGSKLLC